MEFAILVFPFLLLLFALLGTGLAFVGEAVLDRAVLEAGRQISVGQVANSNMSEADFRRSICDDTYGLFTCADLKIDVHSYANYSDLPRGPPLSGSGNQRTLNTSGFGYQQGTQNTIMTVQIYYEWNILVSPIQRFFSNMQSGAYLIGSISAFKTEPFNAN